MPLTLDLAAFCAGLRFDDLPAGALPFIRTGFTDCVATLIAGRHDPVTQKLHAVLAPAPGESTLYFGLGTAQPGMAAWLNATAAHALDFDDAAQRGHLSTVLVPSILAEADALRATGPQMATAYAAGYEAWSELIRREPDHYHNHSWHPTGVFGPIAVAAACASLRGLDAGMTAHALAIAASQSAGLIANFGSMTKPFHAGRAANAGLVAAALAQAGFTGSTEALEHPKGLMRGISPAGRVDLESPLEAGRIWKLPRGGVNIKKYPSCFAAHRALDGMLDLLAEHPVTPAQVERIVVTTSRRNRSTLRYEQPRTGLQAKFSMHFAMASALIARRAGLTELDDAFVLRDDVQALMRRVEVLPEDREDPERPGEAPQDVVMFQTTDGRQFSRAVDYVRGGPEQPLRPGELFAKFENCLAAGGVRGAARPLFDALAAIDSQPGMAGLYRLAES
ncbi:MmgE/PrpD family protein (plasmid) [Variovorax sp. SRS16]|uniref:MmgE/PrpD family protein n=1 Tax=Variovorax sp. SRS16 TaxID=282217 RepID=UPI001317B4D1|nr:MmgE/PrpD family protein [Variovorax sp. SRS16]VTU45633.1 MmgE/PrpD family protein [Variovorax sp. SRS16]